eukprot:g12804.t1
MASVDRDALLALFRATDGEGWEQRDHWGTNTELAVWYGVEIVDEGRVMKIHLVANALRGPIPPLVGNLAALQHLNLGANHLSGFVPPQLRNLAALLHLDLHHNQLSGSIPAELGNLAALQQLWLVNNQLSGSIPADLGNLAALQQLCLGHNQLSGSIPADLGNLAALQHLYLGDNQLSGSIPAELGNLAALQQLWLVNNQLSGSIPANLGNVTALQHLGLANNQLSGSIPADLGNLAALQHLYLGDNQLSGSIPADLGNLSALQHLWLQHNQLSGSVPEELGKLTALKKLVLNRNELTGIGTGDRSKFLLPGLLRQLELGFDLSHNPWELPPAAIVASGRDIICGFFNELTQSSVDAEEIQSLKVVFAGHSGAGKTSLIKTILTGSGKLAQVNELETVGVEVSDFNSAGRSTKLYDLAGQVDYYGLHQLFMTERAVYVMTWDAAKYLHRKEELVEELMGWISALHLRAPYCTVVLVGTHSDKIAGGWWTKLRRRLCMAPSQNSIMADVEKTLKSKHEAWKARRGISSDGGLKVQEGIVLVTSSPEALENGVSGLLNRFEGLKGTTSFIPPSWSLALVVLDALKYKVGPLDTLRCWQERRPLPSSEVRRTWIAKKAIEEAWEEVQNAMPPDQKAGDPLFAMESALHLREFGGSLLRHDDVVFLDIEDFALRLAPVLNHKTCEHDKHDGWPMFGGACFVGHDAGKKAGGGSYALMVDFCEETGLENIPTAGVLTIRTFGARDGRAVWGAMRYGISTVWRLFGEFPGLSWQAWLECPADEGVVSHHLPKPDDMRSIGSPIVSSWSKVHCPCSVAARVRTSLGTVISPYASMDDVFRAPGQIDGEEGVIVESASEFTAALDEVLRAVARREHRESDAPPTTQGPAERVKEVIKNGIVAAALVVRDGFVGAAVFVAMFGEQIVEAADRWNDLADGGLGKAIPITLVLGLVVLVWVSAYLFRRVGRLGRYRRWWSSPAHRD